MRFANVAVAALFVLASSAVQAQLATFDLSYSGVSFGNTAVATGTITLDENQLINPGFNLQSVNPFVTAVTLTVSGASSGNGTFTLSDFGDFVLDTNGATLDLTQELIGQPTIGDSYGTPSGNGGDFNLFNYNTSTGVLANPTAPQGSNYFTLTTDNGNADNLLLTSFRPAAVPEPGSIALLATSALTGAGLLARRHKNARQAA